MDYNDLNKKAIDIIQQSGEFVERRNNKNIFEEKGKDNFLSYLDLEIQEYLAKSLKNIFPLANIVSEEYDANPDIDDGHYWIIDPIDGTTNLIHNYPHYCTSITLINNYEPIIGITYNPITKDLFRAQKGKGAFLNDKRINVSKNDILQKSILGFGFPYDKTKILPIVDLLKKAIFKSQDLRRTGSAALDLAYVACGRIDGFFELDLEIWDFAAGSLLISEAGGNISDWKNLRLNFKDKSNIIATNNLIHKELLELINSTNI
ncbi:inositol monophosphatase [Crocinitomicaceae bacterium CZZ-1]|uniref:Inositol-1-monophosphatase n=1 Tax=Taishania pollutisoli TaxID=2766479 RepID=A0A8J6PC28_9FLAO|nr:inositol monophosphatase family protein [Taishania pollutisoli]MBC9812388.1 inositol monophosphatase [Taishania pollutisoli]